MEERNYTGLDLTGYIETKKNKGIITFEGEEETLSPIVFVKHLISWVYWRILGFVSYILSVLINLQKAALLLRTDMLQLFYWGRTGSFAIFLQSFIVFAAFVSVFVALFDGGLKAVTAQNTQIVEFETVATQNNEDLLVETGSLQTVGPQERTRIEMETYTVRPADTMQVVADKYEISVDSLRWANNLKPNDSLTTGQSLKIPPGTGIMYTVQSGESLEALASRHNASPQAIIEANWLESGSAVKSGMELFIPNGTLPQPTQAPTARRSTTTASRSTTITAPGATKFLGWPVQGGKGNITQCPNTWNKHIALDIADSSGPMLVAAAAGTVTYAGYHPSGYAWVVEIDHGNGYSTLYAHMVSRSIQVSVGQQVYQGDILGRMGQTGLAYGVHLHFEVAHGGSLKKSKRTLVPPPAYMVGSYCGY